MRKAIPFMTSRKDRRHELRRKAILEVAEIFFARHGIAATTLDQVGFELGVTRASLYYYYKNKDDLVVAVLRKALAEINRKAALEMQGLDDPLEKLKVRSRIYVLATVSTPSGKLIASSFDLLMGNADAATLLANDERNTRNLLNEASRLGLIRDVDLGVATKLLYEALNRISKWCTVEGGSAESVFESTWQIFLGGVKKSSPL